MGMESWGPSHQSTGTPKRRGGGWRWPIRVLVALAALGVLNGATDGESTGTIVGNTVIFVLLAVISLPASWQQWALGRLRHQRLAQAEVVGDPLLTVRDAARRSGGVYLGLDENAQPRFSRSERAVLLLGPPRSGKTSSVIIPRSSRTRARWCRPRRSRMSCTRPGSRARSRGGCGSLTRPARPRAGSTRCAGHRPAPARGTGRC